MKRRKRYKRNPKILEKDKKQHSNEKLRQIASNTDIIKATFTTFGIIGIIILLAMCIQII